MICNAQLGSRRPVGLSWNLIWPYLLLEVSEVNDYRWIEDFKSTVRSGEGNVQNRFCPFLEWFYLKCFFKWTILNLSSDSRNNRRLPHSEAVQLTFQDGTFSLLCAWVQMASEEYAFTFLEMRSDQIKVKFSGQPHCSHCVIGEIEAPGWSGTGDREEGKRRTRKREQREKRKQHHLPD